jgi:hypothetical protein
MKSLPLVILACGVLTGSVRGDAAPPFLRDVTYRGSTSVRFDNLKDYPSFDFFLKYERRTRGASSSHVMPVRSAAVIELEGDVGGEMYLLAVPHGQAAPQPRKPLTELPSYCLKSERLQGIDSGAGYLVPYRVRIENDKLEVAMQSIKWLPGDWLVWWLKRLPCIAVPIAFCLALGWLGARIARRLFPAKPVPSAGERPA